jgi:hypothetical protein
MEKQVTRVEQFAAMFGAMAITALVGTGAWLALQHSQAAALRATQRAESLRVQRVMLEAGQSAQAAWIATTPPEVRARQKEAALREFQAAEAEMQQQQTLARLAREARAASAVPQKETGR